MSPHRRLTGIHLATLVFLCIAWGSQLFCGRSCAAETSAPPNILLIVSDDQGYSDLGCYGSSDALTPHLDKIAAGGVRLTSFYVAWPACTPSRGSLLTGRYPQRNGVYDMIRNEAPDFGYKYKPEEYRVSFERVGGMDEREVLLPQMLKQAGYISGIFGKWDLGVHKRFLPLQRGFDDFYGFCNTGIDYFTHERYGVPSMFSGNLPTESDKGTYCTNLFLREAMRFLDQREKQGDGTQPFFLYLPFNAPHSASNLDPRIRGAAQAPPTYHDRFPKLKDQAGYQPAQKYGAPAEVPNRALRRLETLASLAAMDDAIGTVLDKLDAMNASDNTIVIFFSDNGGDGSSDNSPLSGRKAQLLEGGIRVPCLVRWPGHIPAGSVSDAFLCTLEIVPTLLAAATVEPDSQLTFDGFNMLPVLQGEKSQRSEMFWQRRGDRAARVGNWKWLESDQQSGLFDLSADIAEKRDLSKTHPEKATQLRQRFDNWTAQMEAAEPRGPFRDY